MRKRAEWGPDRARQILRHLDVAEARRQILVTRPALQLPDVYAHEEEPARRLSPDARA